MADGDIHTYEAEMGDAELRHVRGWRGRRIGQHISATSGLQRPARHHENAAEHMPMPRWPCDMLPPAILAPLAALSRYFRHFKLLPCCRRQPCNAAVYCQNATQHGMLYHYGADDAVISPRKASCCNARSLMKSFSMMRAGCDASEYHYI